MVEGRSEQCFNVLVQWVWCSAAWDHCSVFRGQQCGTASCAYVIEIRGAALMLCACDERGGEQWRREER
jgi:hypothetical protein